MNINVFGIILRETPVKESDKFLTVLTAEYGKLSVYANGVRSYKSKWQSCCRPMCYNEFVLYKKGTMYWLREVGISESFYEIRDDLSRSALAMYLLDLCDEVTLENNDESRSLSLLLNSLYLIMEKKKPLPLIKAAFELRLCEYAGFLPDLGVCAVCGKSDGIMFLDVMNGVLKCPGCIPRPEEPTEEGISVIIKSLSPSVLAAMRYTVSAQDKRVFAFALEDDALRDFSSVCECYIINHLERGFETLNFYKETVRLDG